MPKWLMLKQSNSIAKNSEVSNALIVIFITVWAVEVITIEKWYNKKYKDFL
jgi:ATP/ADP translocase